MKSITLNECGDGSLGGYIGSFGCSPDLSPRTMRVLYGPTSDVKRRMKKQNETTKEIFNQSRVNSCWNTLIRAFYGVEVVIETYDDLIEKIEKKIAKCKDKEKVKVGKKAIAEMRKRLPLLKKAHSILDAIEQAEIAIPYESGNKVFVV